MSAHAENRKPSSYAVIVVTCYLAVLAALLYPVAGVLAGLG